MIKNLSVMTKSDIELLTLILYHVLNKKGFYFMIRFNLARYKNGDNYINYFGSSNIHMGKILH